MDTHQKLTQRTLASFFGAETDDSTSVSVAVPGAIKVQTQQTLLSHIPYHTEVSENHQSLGSKRTRSNQLTRIENKVDALTLALNRFGGAIPTPPAIQHVDPDEERDYRQGPRVAYTFNRKMRTILQAEATSVLKESERSGIAVSTIRGWVADRDHISDQIYYGRGRMERFKPLQKYDDLFKLLYDEYLQLRDYYMGMPIQAARAFCALNSEAFGALSIKRQYENLAVFKRHYGLRIRKTTSTAQLLPVDSASRILVFHRMLRRAFDFMKPTRIIVLDETSVLWYPSSKSTLAHKGAKTVKSVVVNEKLASTALLIGECIVTYGDDGEATSVVGHHHEPWMIFKGGWAKDIHKDFKARHVRATATDSAWMTSMAMREWVRRGLPRYTDQKETWMILDCFAAHKDRTFITMLQEKNITPFYIPGGLTSLLQVHDTHINKQFKDNMVQLQHAWMVRDKQPLKRCSREDVIEWASSALNKVGTSALEKGVLSNILKPVLALPKGAYGEERPPVVVPKSEKRMKVPLVPFVAPAVTPATIKYRLRKPETDDDVERAQAAREEADLPDLLGLLSIQNPHAADRTKDDVVLEEALLDLQMKEDEKDEVYDVDDFHFEPAREVVDHLEQLPLENTFIASSLLLWALQKEGVPWLDLQTIRHPHAKGVAIDRIVRTGMCNVGVLLWHADHYIGCVASKDDKKFYVRDSSDGYCPRTRDLAVNEAVRFFVKQWEVNLQVVHLKGVPQQLKHTNDCGTHAINNILYGLDRTKTYSRATLYHAIKKGY